MEASWLFQTQSKSIRKPLLWSPFSTARAASTSLWSTKSTLWRFWDSLVSDSIAKGQSSATYLSGTCTSSQFNTGNQQHDRDGHQNCTPLTLQSRLCSLSLLVVPQAERQSQQLFWWHWKGNGRCDKAPAYLHPGWLPQGPLQSGWGATTDAMRWEGPTLKEIRDLYVFELSKLFKRDGARNTLGSNYSLNSMTHTHFEFFPKLKQPPILVVMMVDDINSLLVSLKCSIILRSRHCGGQIKCSTSLECSLCHSEATLAVWIGALSSSKIVFLSRNSSTTRA